MCFDSDWNLRKSLYLVDVGHVVDPLVAYKALKVVVLSDHHTPVPLVVSVEVKAP